jgi:hypothetical protein
MNVLGSIDGKITLVTDTSYGFDMVSMVMRNQHMMYRTKAEAIVPKLLF